MHTVCGGADQDPHSRVYFLAQLGGRGARRRREEREEKAAEGSDDVGLRRQGMRKTLKPAGDAQQPWPAAPRQSDFEQKIEND